jgi:hypothetical protein
MALLNPYRVNQKFNPVTKAPISTLGPDYGLAMNIGPGGNPKRPVGAHRASLGLPVPNVPGVSQMTPDEYNEYIAAQGENGIFMHQNFLATEDAQRRTEEGRLAGIATLTDARRTGEEAYGRYLSDPNRQLIFGELTRRSTEPLFTPAQRSAATNQLGQLYTQNLSRMRQRAASAGVLDTGGQSGFEAGLGTATESANLQLKATMDAADRQAQDNALQLLSQYQAADVGLTQGFVNDLARISGGIAALEAGLEVQPTDFMAFRAVQFAQQQWEDFSAAHWAEVERLEKAGKWTGADTLNLFLSMIGGGIPGMALNIAGNLFG